MVCKEGRPKILSSEDLEFLRHHYLLFGPSECLICRRTNQVKTHSCEHHKAKRRKWTNTRRQTKLGKYRHRLRGLLRNASKGTISYTKDLPYSSQELCDHLEMIRKLQDNKCPMCDDSYDVVVDNIDHVIPVSSANTATELLELFCLDNLSLLCPKCNQHIKRDRIDVTYG